MTKTDNIVQIIAAIVLAVCLAASAALGTAISAEAGRAQLVYTDRATDGDPPAVALGIAMGAFRGLFVNYLWLRANHLKEEGRFHEAIELSSAITKLQPRFPRVWAFHAWNMAYNISVATPTAEERWQWVQAGIRLLRDEGIPMNRNDVLLHKELAWIFVHKIQGFSDDANRYYKRRVAEEWTWVLGTPPALPEDTQEARRIMNQWFARVANAPDTLEGVINRELAERRAAVRPEEREQVTSLVRELVDRIRREAGLQLDLDLLRVVAYYDAYRSAWYADSATLRISLAETRRNRALEALLEDEQFADAWDRLIPHVRRRVLINDYNMDPGRMLHYMERFGPLDWRHPASHAAYWSAKGVELGLRRDGVDAFNTVNTDRITVHAMQELFRTGTIYYDLITNDYSTLINLHYTDTYGEIVETLADRGGIAEDRRERAYTLMSAGYENFLKDVVRTYYRMGDIETAERYRQRYITWPGRNINDPREFENDALSLTEWVREVAFDRLNTPYVATSEVEAALRDAYIRGLLGGDMDVFQAQYRYALEVHRYYYTDQNIRTLIDRDANRMEFMPRDFREMAGLVMLRLIGSGSVGQLQASRIYERSPVALRQIIFDDLRNIMAQRGMPQGRFEQLFPEPPDMDRFRQERQERMMLDLDSEKGQLQLQQR